MVIALDRLLERHEMTVLQAKIMFHVAANPGITQRDCARDMQQHSASVVSRAMALLSEIGLRGQDGLDLIKWEIDPTDRRQRKMWLSPKGERLVGDIARDLGF
jgi:DNA-binding MarR family transcriptional regulator